VLLLLRVRRRPIEGHLIVGHSVGGAARSRIGRVRLHGILILGILVRLPDHGRLVVLPSRIQKYLGLYASYSPYGPGDASAAEISIGCN